MVRCGKPLVAGGGPRTSAGADGVLGGSSWVWELGLEGLGTGWEESRQRAWQVPKDGGGALLVVADGGNLGILCC